MQFHRWLLLNLQVTGISQLPWWLPVVCMRHGRKINANRNIFFFVKTNDPRKPEIVYLKFDWHHLHQAGTRKFVYYRAQTWPSGRVGLDWDLWRYLLQDSSSDFKCSALEKPRDSPDVNGKSAGRTSEPIRSEYDAGCQQQLTQCIASIRMRRMLPVIY
jgi:hypothetical protein